METIKICFLFLYIVAVSTLLIIIGIKVQIKYFNNWENNTCIYLNGFVLAWLIINYFQLFLHLLHFSFICYYCFKCCKWMWTDEG